MGPSSALVRGLERKLGKITRPESSADFSPLIGHFRLFDLSIDHIIDAYPRIVDSGRRASGRTHVASRRARHAGKRSDGRFRPLAARVAPRTFASRTALNLADPLSRLAFSRLRCRHGSNASPRNMRPSRCAIEGVRAAVVEVAIRPDDCCIFSTDESRANHPSNKADR
jgi:hypothetical protein